MDIQLIIVCLVSVVIVIMAIHSVTSAYPGTFVRDELSKLQEKIDEQQRQIDELKRDLEKQNRIE